MNLENYLQKIEIFNIFQRLISLNYEMYKTYVIYFPYNLICFRQKYPLYILLKIISSRALSLNFVKTSLPKKYKKNLNKLLGMYQNKRFVEISIRKSKKQNEREWIIKTKLKNDTKFDFFLFTILKK